MNHPVREKLVQTTLDLGDSPLHAKKMPPLFPSLNLGLTPELKIDRELPVPKVGRLRLGVTLLSLFIPAKNELALFKSDHGNTPIAHINPSSNQAQALIDGIIKDGLPLSPSQRFHRLHQALDNYTKACLLLTSTGNANNDLEPAISSLRKFSDSAFQKFMSRNRNNQNSDGLDDLARHAIKLADTLEAYKKICSIFSRHKLNITNEQLAKFYNSFKEPDFHKRIDKFSEFTAFLSELDRSNLLNQQSLKNILALCYRNNDRSLFIVDTIKAAAQQIPDHISAEEKQAKFNSALVLLHNMHEAARPNFKDPVVMGFAICTGIRSLKKEFALPVQEFKALCADPARAPVMIDPYA